MYRQHGRLALYRGPDREFAEHYRINHASRVYVDGKTHMQTVEVFGLIKGGLAGVYLSVSREWLQSTLDEYSFRWNHRHHINPHPMFWSFLDQITGRRPAAA